MRIRARVLAFVVAIVIAIGSSPFVMGFMSLASSTSTWGFDAPGQSSSIFSSKPVDFTNSDFIQNTSSNGFIFNSNTVSGWERDSKLSTSGVVAGVLNTKEFTTWKNQNVRNLDFLRVNPSTSLTNNSNVLAITNDTESSSEQGARAHAGFLSNPIEFEADSHFVVTVDYYAVSGFGSFYLIPTDEFDSEITPLIYLDQSTYGKDGQSLWRTASFYVSTDILDNQTFRIGLYLGSQTDTSKGVIYFQNATVTQYSSALFNQLWDAASKQYLDILEGTDLNFNDIKPLVKKIDLSQEYEINQKATDRLSFMKINPLENIEEVTDIIPGFVTNHYDLPYKLQYLPNLANPHNTVIESSVSTNRIPQILNFEDVEHLFPAKPALVDVNSNSSVVVAAQDVMVLAAKEQVASMRLENPFIVKRQQIYMVSFYSLTADGQNASIRVRDIRYKDENRPQTPKLAEANFYPINQSATAPHLNGWVLNTMFIVGECYEDLPVDIEFWIGEENQEKTDYVLIDDFQIQRVSTEYYNKHSIDEDTHVINLDLSEQSVTINNAEFDLGTPNSIENPYPLVVNDWSVSCENEESALNGIINTDPEHWFTYNNAYGIAEPIGAIEKNNIKKDINNNVFMMQNSDVTWQKLSSNTFSLTKGINVISFDVARQYYPTRGMDLWAVIETYDTEIAKINLSKKAEGTKRTLTTIDWENFSFAIKESEFTQRQVKISFMLGNQDKFSQPAVVYIDNVSHESLEADAEINATVTTNLANTNRFFASDSSNTQLSYDEKSNELSIFNTENKTSATVVNKLAETLESGNYYEYAVQVRIIDRGATYIKQYNEDGDDITDFTEEYDYGVNFKLDGLSGGFDNLNQSLIYDMWSNKDDFVTLRFFVCPNQETDLVLKIEFGNKYMAVQSEVIIRETSLTVLSGGEDEFNGYRDDYNKAVSDNKNHNLAVITEISYENAESPQEKSTHNIDWIVVIPAIILAVTLLFAIVAVSLRHINFKKHIAKFHTSYSRDDRSSRNAASTRSKKVD